MEFKEYIYYLEHVGKDPSRLIFEDELTGLYNRRFLHNYFQHNVPWDSLETNPVSLIMMDVDYFKNINDTYGHNVGDQALVWVADLLKEVAGDKNLPIRYAGDEFMILMPKAEKQSALKLGESLIRLVHEKGIPLDEGDGEIAITLSIGVASAPHDARGDKALIQKADTALYYAKKAGRDRLANAGAIAAQDVFVKTALHQLGKATIAGRKEQLAKVAESLKRFSQKQSQFLIAEGAPGMGKTMFLETVQRSLAQSKSIVQVKVSGQPQELYRPYYLISNIVVSLLQHREDKGEAVFKSLEPEERAYLSQILPQLGETKEIEPGDEKAYREGVFATLIKLIKMVVDSKPTVFLIDDMHLGDQATLLLLRRVVMRKEIPVFVLGATSDAPQGLEEGLADTLGRFWAAYGEELNITKVSLTALTSSDIVSHLRAIFPRVSLPKGFDRELEQVTQGNPLFLSEIVRKLVLDGKISLSGQQWVIHPLEEGYLPRSLEEIVREKVSVLDEESRQLLDQAAIFGDNVSLSALTGSAETSEAKILEFVDKAISQGILNSDFQINDETIRFLSRRVQDIAYGAIEKDVREVLHERVGNYQESLYEKDLLTSAATLAYHFKRSANQEKAKSYEQIQAGYNSAVFSAEEAIFYTGEGPAEARPKGAPLDSESLAQIPNVFRTLLLAVRNAMLYPPGSKSIIIANQQVKEALDEILEKNELLTMFQIERSLVVNGQRADVSEFKIFADSFLKFLGRLELKGIAVQRGLTEDELNVLVDALGRTKKEMIEEGFWQRFIEEKKLTHVDLTQVRYTVSAEGTDAAHAGMGKGVARAEEIASKLAASEQRMDTEELAYVPEFTRFFLNAARSIKLYPLKSKAIESAIQQVMDILRRLLAKRPALTLARVGDFLLVNGEKWDTSEYEILVKSFLKFLDSISLKSITFLENISSDEIKTFIGALEELPEVGLDSSFWTALARKKGLSGILFDQRLYEARMSPSMLAAGKGQAKVKQKVAKKRAPAREPVVEESIETLLDKMPVNLSDLLLKGEEKQIKQAIRRLFRGYLRGSSQPRQNVVSRCQGLMEGLNLGLQNQLAKLLADPLLLVLSQEEDPMVLKDLANFLHQLATLLLQFVEYPAATRILLHLHRRRRKFLESDGEQAGVLGQILGRALESKTQQLIMEDFRSGEPSRQQSAAQLLGSLGTVTMPLLVNIIKNEEDLRIRQLAASLLTEQGPEAAKMLKRELAMQTNSGERLRILQVIDSVTRDLRAELPYAFADENSQVREEAFRLTERLNNAEAERLLVECTENENVDVAIGAIKSLGRLKRGGTLEKLASLLESAEEEKRLIACCQAIGRIGHPASIEALGKVLFPKRFFWRRKRYSGEVRANAAFALAQIKDPRARDLLESCIEDKDQRVREIAHATLANQDKRSEPKSMDGQHHH
ncbi:MAG: diguanylate cyclase [Desulfobacteraceae bacterium]|jgi:diguanylate cyclase (GGDEF)-like protein